MKQFYTKLVCHFRGHKTARIIEAVKFEDYSPIVGLHGRVTKSHFRCVRCGKDPV